jgi:hypothetical protein
MLAGQEAAWYQANQSVRSNLEYEFASFVKYKEMTMRTSKSKELNGTGQGSRGEENTIPTNE